VAQNPPLYPTQVRGLPARQVSYWSVQPFRSQYTDLSDRTAHTGQDRQTDNGLIA